MTVSLGTCLGRYEIRSQIGAGGMGEVYLAEDMQLRRQVALKILPAAIAANQDRMRRFVQEARAAAALNHPNIAHIYEIGEHDGTHFIAMEFIEGHTLRELIHGGPSDLAKLLRYLQHVAEGLAKAHAAGIVHRDLKPDNIMVTREGHAKILDFGLAKLIEPQQASQTSSEAASELATVILQQHSTPGVVLGTVGYMSPEQAQGKGKEIGKYDEAIAEFRQVLNLSAGKPLGMAALAHAYALSGKVAEAQKTLAELQEISKRRYVSPAAIAIIYAALGDKDQAFDWLEKANKARDATLARLKVDPRFDSLRSDPRFNDLLRRIGIP